MPAVMDAPEIGAYKEHDLNDEQPQVRTTPRGFWHTVVAYVGRHRAHRLHGTPLASHGSRHPIETPAELLARAYPTLYVRAFCGV